MLHEHFQRRKSQLRVTRLIRLNTGEQVREIHVTGLHGIGRQCDELHVRKAVLDGETHGHGGFDAIGVQHPIVKEILDRQYAPFIRVKGFVAPVKALVVLEQVMRKG